jgi:hypothetical protein
MPEQSDITENDTQFGKAAAEKAEAADRMADEGQDPSGAPEGAGSDPRPRAGGKASEGAPPAAEEEVDESTSKESFPASDPPSSY